MASANNFKITNRTEMKFGWIVENYEAINLVWFNWHKMSTLRHNDVITKNVWFL